MTTLALSLAISVVVAAAVTAAAAPFLGPGSKSRFAAEPWKLTRFCVIPGFIASYVALGRRGRPPFLQAAGLAGVDRPVASAAVGLVAGLAALAAMNAALVAAGATAFVGTPPVLDLLKKSAWWLVSGLFLAAWEESLFRGLIFGDLARAAGAKAAALGGAAFFALSHFFRAPRGFHADPADPWFGPRCALSLFQGFERVVDEWRQPAGLLLLGLALAALRIRTRGVLLGLGIHAGFFFASRAAPLFVRPPDADARDAVWFGSKLYYDGVAGWAALAAAAAITFAIRPKPAGPHPAEAHS